MKIQVKIFLLFYFLFLSCEKSEPKSILETRKGYLTGIGNSTTNWKLKGITIDGLPQQLSASLAATQAVWVNITTTGFTINTNATAVVSSTAYKWNYVVIQ